MNEREPLRKRLGRFIALVAIVFALTTAVVVTQKLNTDALALIVGVTLGVVAMAPTLGLGWLVWRREVARTQAQVNHSVPATPPVIVVTPFGNGVPFPNDAYSSQRAALEAGANWSNAPTERRFTIVGGEE
ncbi:MAG: hypothetical protein JXA33_27235 [Anaerolineae bacterium]|nr:hypothetical protein [Anaerolineae bacterium]